MKKYKEIKPLDEKINENKGLINDFKEIIKDYEYIIDVVDDNLYELKGVKKKWDKEIHYHKKIEREKKVLSVFSKELKRQIVVNENYINEFKQRIIKLEEDVQHWENKLNKLLTD